MKIQFEIKIKLILQISRTLKNEITFESINFFGRKMKNNSRNS